MNKETVFTRFLALENIPHTRYYSSRRFKAYPPGLAVAGAADLLREYGVPHDLLEVKDKSLAESRQKFDALSFPCMLQLPERCLIALQRDGSDILCQDRTGAVKRIDLQKLYSLWKGMALTAYPVAGCGETDLARHRFYAVSSYIEKWVFFILAAFLLSYFFISNRIYDSWSRTAATVLYASGLYISYLLILKQSNVHSAAADSVCSVIQRTGCGTVLNTAGSSLFGLFHWSEIGLAYFSVSLFAQVICPEVTHWLAALNIMCLGYSLWSVTYQKFVAKAWCTLCLSVQTLFWIIFACYLIGGDLHGIFPLRMPLVVLLAIYGVTLLGIHRLVPVYFKYELMEDAGEIPE